MSVFWIGDMEVFMKTRFHTPLIHLGGEFYKIHPQKMIPWSQEELAPKFP